MKIGIITDIHSNIQALDAVLDEFDKINVEKILCCGDIIGLGLNPDEVVQKLIQRKETLVAVKGNHENYCINGLPKYVHDDKRELRADEIANHNWNHNKISENSKQFLSQLRFSEDIEIEGVKVHIVHYPMKENGEFKKFIKKPTIEECKEMFNNNDADIFLFGHTHICSINNENGKWYINPGSLGCPMGTTYAKAGILEIKNKNVTYKNLDIEYDAKGVINKIKEIKIPRYEDVLKVFYY